MGILIMVGQLLLSLAILVTLHELGHFLAARLFKIRVDKFYLFFDFLFPLPTVMNFSLWKKKIGNTLYGIGWFPLGGYVQIAGMIDEQMDKDALDSEPQPDEFRAKKPWQKLIVLLGGIIFNIILGIIIFIGIKYTWGESQLSLNKINSKFGIYASPNAVKAGFNTGDKILKVNGKEVQYLSDVINADVMFGNEPMVTIERKGQIVDVKLDKDLPNLIAKGGKKQFIGEAYEFEIEEATKNMNAEKAGIKAKDRILAVNNQSAQFFQTFQELLGNNKGKKIELTVLRKQDTLKIPCMVNEDGKLGLVVKNITFSEKDMDKKVFGFGESIIAGTKEAFNSLMANILGLGKVITGKVNARDAISGPVGIAQLFSSQWDWSKFWTITGLLSMALAFMNVLPIPGLDGGHCVIVLWEMIFRKPMPIKAQYVLQVIGTVIILGLLVLVLGNDIFKLLGK